MQIYVYIYIYTDYVWESMIIAFNITGYISDFINIIRKMNLQDIKITIVSYTILIKYLYTQLLI